MIKWIKKHNIWIAGILTLAVPIWIVPAIIIGFFYIIFDGIRDFLDNLYE